MIAVFGPKSLYSLLAMRIFPSLELSVANIIQQVRAKNAAMKSQSTPLEPSARGTLSISIGVWERLTLKIRWPHRGQVNTPIATPKKQRFPQETEVRNAQKPAPSG